MCEEFECSPGEAVELPFGLCTRIMSLRDYAGARSLVEHADGPGELKMTPSIERVLGIQAELAMADVKADLIKRKEEA